MRSELVAFSKIALTAIVIAYPIIVYFGLDHFESRTLAIFLIGLAVARLILMKRVEGWTEKMPQAKFMIAALLIVCGVVIFSNSPDFLRYYPVIVSIIMFIVFFGSLFNPPTIIEQIARLQTPNLSGYWVGYTRKVTIVWCGFFVLNGTLALYTCLSTNIKIWALYNGLVSYLLMGVLFVGEFIIRRYLQRNPPVYVESNE
jgi:uncharacterized membrane protein